MELKLSSKLNSGCNVKSLSRHAVDIRTTLNPMLMTAKGVSKSVEDSCVCVLKLYIFFRNFVVEIFIENQVIYTVFKGGGLSLIN